MGLRATAQADMNAIVTDAAMGFGWPVTFTDPDGVSGLIDCLAGDISEFIDPETGQAVSGRLATIAASIQSLTENSLGLPQGIEDETKKPWLVTFSDISGNSFTFKIISSNPDRTLGIVTCTLGIYS